MKLYFDLGNNHALKVLIAAHLNQKHIDVAITDHEAAVVPFMKKSKLPVLELDDGTHIFTPNAASRLMFPVTKDPCVEGLVDQWLEWESTQFQPISHQYLSGALGSGKPDVSGVKQLLAELQQDLASPQPLVGRNTTAAEGCLWAALFPYFNSVAPFKALREEFPAQAAWFDNLAAQAAFQSAVETVYAGKVKENLKMSVLSQPAPLLPCTRSRKTVSAPAASTQQSTEEASSEPAVSAEEVSTATEAWLHGRKTVMAPRSRQHPILPQKGQKNILITSALPYVNNVPHLGNIIGCVLSADVYSRFCRLRNYNSLYICGTDEYGTATETKAVEEGLTPQQICDKYNKLHAEIYQWFNIDFDHFGRTTTQQQTEIAQSIFWDLHKNGFILEDTVEQLQCQQCDRFLADRFVEGTCPLCGYEDARGDQCDKCGKLINAVELKKPRCKLCQNPPIVKTSRHLFLDLPKLEPQLSSYLENEFDQGIWTHNTKVISRSWIRDGLKPRCISRDLKWGTPVPLQGYTDKVFYVWYDAPIGYISITANYTKDWEKWWKNPKEVNLFNFMAKDNIPFHSVIFPCTLLGTKGPWTIVNNLSATEYLNYEDGKFSKSRGVGVFGNNAQDTGIPADVWRFYLLFLRPESQDSAFSWDDFLLKNNSELLNNLGNFINRALMFVNNTFAGVIPAVELNDDDKELLALITRELRAYVDNLEKCRLRDGIRNMLSISRLGNQYIQANKPWVLVKGSPEERRRGGSVVGLAANISCLLSVLVQPYMPGVSREIQSQLAAPAACNVLTECFVCFLPEGHKIGKPKPLFQKIEACTIEALKKKFAGQQVSNPAASGSTGPASPEDVTRLTAEVAKQGEVVRQLKAAKADKDTIGTAVSKLLDLKKQLAQAQGGDPSAGASSGGKKKNNGKNASSAAVTEAAPATNSAATIASPEEVARLNAEVTKQGDVVRQLKTSKAEKDVIGAEVARLLDLKKQLAQAQGEDTTKPASSAGGKKKKKGKK